MTSVLKITAGESIKVTPLSRIIRGADAVDLTTISKALESARLIEAESSRRSEEAREKGYRQGYEDGLSLAKAESAIELAGMVQKEVSLLSLLTPRLEKMIRDCVEGFLGERLASSSSFQSHFRQLLNHLDTEAIRRVIAPASRASEVEEALRAAFAPEVSSMIEVVESTDLAKHELVIEARTLVIDARVGSHFDQTIEAFKRQLNGNISPVNSIPGVRITPAEAQSAE